MEKTKRLRTILDRPGCTFHPAVYDGISAVVMEQAGFDLLGISGAGVAASLHGLPDLGFLSFEDMLNATRRIVGCTSVPVYVDGDTGYGNALNVARAVREFERAGAAGVFFEDQVWPKKCGHLEGKAVIDTAAFGQKIRAAVAARRDPDFIVMARTDAIAVHGVEDAIDRGARCAEVGADVVFVEAPTTLDEVRRVARGVKAPLLYNNATGGKSPALSGEALAELGFKLSVVPTLALLPAVHAMREAGRIGRETGSDAHVAATGLSPRAFFEIFGLDDWRRLEKKYSA